MPYAVERAGLHVADAHCEVSTAGALVQVINRVHSLSVSLFA